jgi:single-strand DNA-binding protein
MDLNQQTLVGRAGKEAVLFTLPNGTEKAKVSIATGGKSPHGEQITEWHNVTAFGKAAEMFAKYIQKGTRVYIQGDRVKSNYTKNGEEKTYIEIVTRKVLFLDKTKTSFSTSTNTDNPHEDSELPF